MKAWLRERVVWDGEVGPATNRPRWSEIDGGASFAYVFGATLVFLLGFEALTGFALAMFYSPSATDAWGSVAYVQDQTSWGWLVRGLHHHGGGAIVVVAGLHLVQTAVAGAYKRPRELVWWLGVALLGLVVVWAVTGYVLRWDQEGYWANRVELGIAAGSPIIGEGIRKVALGGNDYGNLTLTRFYALHVLLFPAIVGGLTYVHVRLARRHGTTPVRAGKPAPRFPDQAVRNALAMALALAILMAFVVAKHGVELAAPADPSQAYDARPLWYFRWLFELRELAGSAEKLAALAAPAIVGGFLVALPLMDRSPSRQVRARLPWLGGLAGMLALIGALTMMSFARDANDADLAKRQQHDAELADRARALAAQNGVPATGAQDVWATAPMYRGRTLFADKCRGCHEDPKTPKDPDRRGPLIGPGHGNRAWIAGLIRDPSGDKYWGHTTLLWKALVNEAWKDTWLESVAPPKVDPMPPIKVDGADADKDMAALVELVYAQSGASDVDAARRDAGMPVFKNLCGDCHEIVDGVPGVSGPGLGGLNSREYFFSFISNPAQSLHMGPDKSEMPRFDKELSAADRDAIAEYLVWLRGATADDLVKLGPL